MLLRLRDPAIMMGGSLPFALAVAALAISGAADALKATYCFKADAGCGGAVDTAGCEAGFASSTARNPEFWNSTGLIGIYLTVLSVI